MEWTQCTNERVAYHNGEIKLEWENAPNRPMKLSRERPAPCVQWGVSTVPKFQADPYERHFVSTRVNSVRNYDPDILAPRSVQELF